MHDLSLPKILLTVTNGAVLETQQEGINHANCICIQNGNNHAIRLPCDLDFDGINELEIIFDGDTILLRSVKPSWASFRQEVKADADFMTERTDMVSDEGRFEL